MNPQSSTRTREASSLDSMVLLEREWAERGAAALSTLREFDPTAYIRLIATVIDEDD